MTAVSLSINAKLNKRMSKNRSRRVASEKIRGILNQLADSICESQDKVILSLSGNTFVIHLDDATVNISVNQKGGAL